MQKDPIIAYWLDEDMGYLIKEVNGQWILVESKLYGNNKL